MLKARLPLLGVHAKNRTISPTPPSGRDVSCPLCAETYDLLMHVMRRLYYSTS